MKLGLILVAIISIAALVGTIAAAGKVEKDYGKSTKQNTIRLSAIYIFLFIFSIVGVTWYIVSL
ncbi:MULTISPECIES: hypothetical protein [Bacillaceae]|uniref:Protein-export membrane protein SecG n=1 Tax=Ectobacillus funiculus TaxID=137993 RepID=A0ABV5WF45_9BACI|nr:hypothetical protein [Ectobacillus funiculus]